MTDGIFERTVVDGQVIRETFALPAILPAVLQLKLAVLAKLPGASFNGAFSIGMVKADAFYPEDVATIYYKAEHNHTGIELPRRCESYAIKLGMSTGKQDIKAVCSHTGDIDAPELPVGAHNALVAISIPSNGKGDLYFAFDTEGEYQAYLESVGVAYLVPEPSWPRGMVGLTYDTTTLDVLRVKRYFF